jgi:LPXTG-motif cell wall-anchored protein
MTAEVRPQPPITYTPIPAPEKPEIELFVEPMEYLATEAPAEAPLPIEEPPAEELPRTASPLPLVAFGGFTSLLVGLGIVVLRRRYT